MNLDKSHEEIKKESNKLYECAFESFMKALSREKTKQGRDYIAKSYLTFSCMLVVKFVSIGNKEILEITKEHFEIAFRAIEDHFHEVKEND